MFKRLLSMFPYWLSLILLVVSVVPVRAETLQGPAFQEDGVFSFAEIREPEIRMFGPFSSRDVLFGLPATWELLDGAQMNIDMRVAVRSLSAQAGSAGLLAVGTLAVSMNGQTIAILPLGVDDDVVSQTIPIPASALTSRRSDGRMQLNFQLSSGETCLLDQQLELVILSSTSFVFPHQIVEPDTSFLNFPRPIFQDSILQDTARIVVPDQPTAAELQGALTVAAGLQARTGDGISLDLSRSSELTADDLGSSHLILVGKASTQSLLSQLNLPLGVTDGRFVEGDEVGVLEMVPSPWSSERVILIVSGNTDEAVVKAAQALSTGVIRPAEAPNLALIDQVQALSTTPVVSVDQTLDYLGYDNVVFEGRGETSEPIQFFIPIGLTVTSESFIELSLNHTSLVDYNRSGLFVFLNDQPIGSVRFSDATANQTSNLVRISIPPSAVKSGSNTLDLVSLLNPIDECSDPDQGGLFVTVWSDETRLFLPLAPVSVEMARVRDLSAYPFPFNQSVSLDTMAFVLQNDNPDSWRFAVQIASRLGAVVDGGIMLPRAFYADNVPFEERSKYNFLVIGAPSRMPFLMEINDQLPAPFPDDSDMAIESDLQVIFKVSPQTPVGYVELLESPWNSNNAIFAVLGNLPEGIAWAADALIVEDIRERLSGDFAVISGRQVLSTDTRLSSSFNYIPPTPKAPVEETDSSPVATVQTAKPSWLTTALFVTGGMILVVVLAVLFSGIVRRRKARNWMNADVNTEEPPSEK